MGKIEYEIMAEIGVLSENPAGWRKELNLISGINVHQNLICEIGHRIMPKWVRVWRCQTTKLRP